MVDEGEGLAEHLTNKYGESAAKKFLGPESSLLKSGRKIGIEFSMKKIYPARRAHAVIEFVRLEHNGDENGKANCIMELLFSKYFEQNENPNDLDTLRMVLEEVFEEEGQKDIVEKALGAADSEEMMNQVVEKDSSYKVGQGVSGVPFFIIENVAGKEEQKKQKQPVTFSGAYPPYIIAQELEEMADG